MRNYPQVFITAKAEHSVRGGHPWIFAGAISRIEGTYENGDLVDVVTAKGKYLGTGFINDHSQIRVRLISRNTNDRFDAAFYERRLRYALEYRRTVMGDEDFKCCRLIYGEADEFPGLTVDRYNNILVAQVLSYGIEMRKALIFRLLVQVLQDMGQEVHGIYERNDVKIRALEGLTESSGPARVEGLEGECPTTTIIRENGLLFAVDVASGQKTGYFLDQKYNRLAIRRISCGRRVLDCFTHTGAFALNAAVGGAKSVTAVDISADALALTERNIALNGLADKVKTQRADVFELLTESLARKERNYDFIILDPPAFAKSSDSTHNAYRGYKDINYRAMRLLPRGGYLATCSCSHFMPQELFLRMLKEAACDADVTLRQIEARQQAPDHPILLSVPETDYLKFYLLQVV